MHARLFRRFSHAPLLRVLALFAWLSMAGVPAAVNASFAPNACVTAGMSAAAVTTGGDCCPTHAGTGQAPGQCDACAVSLTGLPVPALFTLAHAAFQAESWPTSSTAPVGRPSIPPLRPPRS